MGVYEYPGYEVPYLSLSVEIKDAVIYLAGLKTRQSK